MPLLTRLYVIMQTFTWLPHRKSSFRLLQNNPGQSFAFRNMFLECSKPIHFYLHSNAIFDVSQELTE